MNPALTLTSTTVDLLIGGERRASSDHAYFDDVSPVDSHVVASIAAASVDDALDACSVAASAQAAWAALPFVERRRILLRAADILESERDSITDLFARETGGTPGWAAMNVHESAATLREAAGLTSSPVGELLPSQDANTLNYSLREPAGVVLAIIPWNAPVILSARAIAIALALGNAIVLRPSEVAPMLAGHVLADVLVRAGVTPGVVNVITNRAEDSPAVITAMIEHPAVRRVVFIGSTAVGRSIASTAARALTPVVAELGGKNSTIVRKDANLEAWIPRLAFAAFANTGQVCMCTDRIIADQSISEELAERLAEFADLMSVGDPREPGTDLGPAISDAAVLRYGDLLADAVDHGAQLLTSRASDGRFLRPAVLTNLSAKCRYYREEGFVPIVSVTASIDDNDAIRLANDGDYGLSGSVISADVALAESLARRIRTGAVHVNGPSVGDEPHVPFGGVSGSGFGRLGGMDSVRFFTEQRTIYRHGLERE
jgi:acyl-CoA reductase-like NAD-dependent aldehyde dehydrogenase